MPLSLLNNNRLQYNLTRGFSEIFLVIIFLEINYLSIREGFQYKKSKKSFISILNRKKSQISNIYFYGLPLSQVIHCAAYLIQKKMT
jgi:hypothetical protein